jgi:hypothetical protein
MNITTDFQISQIHAFHQWNSWNLWLLSKVYHLHIEEEVLRDPAVEWNQSLRF